jgi:hypothetical protein
MKNLILLLFIFASFNLFSQENWKEENLRAITNLQRMKVGLDMVEQSPYYKSFDQFIKTIAKPDTSEESVSKVITQLNNHCDFAFPIDKITIHYGATITDSKNEDADLNLFAQIERQVPTSIFKDDKINRVLFKQWEYKSHGKKIIFIYIVGFLK